MGDEPKINGHRYDGAHVELLVGGVPAQTVTHIEYGVTIRGHVQYSMPTDGVFTGRVDVAIYRREWRRLRRQQRRGVPNRTRSSRRTDFGALSPLLDLVVYGDAEDFAAVAKALTTAGLLSGTTG